MNGIHTHFGMFQTVLCSVSVTVTCDNFADTLSVLVVLHSSVTDEEYFQIPSPCFYPLTEKVLSNQLPFVTQF